MSIKNSQILASIICRTHMVKFVKHNYVPSRQAIFLIRSVAPLVGRTEEKLISLPFIIRDVKIPRRISSCGFVSSLISLPARAALTGGDNKVSSMGLF